MKSTSFIVGNGPSRQSINLMKLAKWGTVFGCNALYRDYEPHFTIPHYLVAIDDRMILEITNSDFPKERCIFPPENDRWEPEEVNPSKPRSNAGMNAILESLKMDMKVLYILGFDFILKSEKFATGNKYKDTKNYEEFTQPTYKDAMGRMRYIRWVIEKNPNVEFNFVIPNGVETHNLEYDNVYGIDIDSFKSSIDNV